MIDCGLDDLQAALNRSIQEGHRIAEGACMLQALEHRSKTIEGVGIVEQGLSKRFICKSGSKMLGFLDICNCRLMSF
jgi:hypothetical protein